jgi:hypothetical protein
MCEEFSAIVGGQWERAQRWAADDTARMAAVTGCFGMPERAGAFQVGQPSIRWRAVSCRVKIARALVSQYLRAPGGLRFEREVVLF